MVNHCVQSWYLQAKIGESLKFSVDSQQNELMLKFFQEEVHQAVMLKLNNLVSYTIIENAKSKDNAYITSFELKKLYHINQISKALKKINTAEEA